MFSWRNILFSVLLLPRLLAHGAETSGALERYNARLDEIARLYREQFAEIRKNERRVGADKAAVASAEREIRQLGLMRTKAIADAKLILEREQKEQKRAELAPASKLTGEQRQKQLMEARRKAIEDGQKAFWEKVTREEPKVAELWAARLQSVEEGQKEFWAGVAFKEVNDAELRAVRRQAVEEAQTAFWTELFGAPRKTPQADQNTTRAQLQYGREMIAAAP